ncbi:MAG: hypothetical protein ACM3U2_10115 [Deltaproteobacteria bacterium]
MTEPQTRVAVVIASTQGPGEAVARELMTGSIVDFDQTVAGTSP